MPRAEVILWGEDKSATWRWKKRTLNSEESSKRLKPKERIISQKEPGTWFFLVEFLWDRNEPLMLYLIEFFKNPFWIFLFIHPFIHRMCMFFLVFTVPSIVLGSERNDDPKIATITFQSKVQVGVYEIRFQNITRNQSSLMEQKVKVNYLLTLVKFLFL